MAGMLNGKGRGCSKVRMLVVVCLGPGDTGIQPLTWPRGTNNTSLGPLMNLGHLPNGHSAKWPLTPFGLWVTRGAL